MGGVWTDAQMVDMDGWIHEFYSLILCQDVVFDREESQIADYDLRP